jgi:putative polyketide hydroxylase
MTVPVLIVGAGPAGLTAAITLARHGVEALLVERRPSLSGLPRAASISTRTMELFRSWGLERRIREGGVDVEWRQWVGPTLAAAGETVQTSFPTREQSAVLSPTGPASVPQDHVEPVLLDHLRTSPTARVRLGTEVVGIRHVPDGVEVALRDVGDGASRTVRARYLVAADGARSTVRAALGVRMHGDARLSRAVAVEFRAPLWDLLGARRYCIYAVTRPDAAGVFVPAGRGDRWVYGIERGPGVAPAADPTPAQAERLIRLGAGVADLRPQVERIGAFTFAAQLADRFQQDRVFLVGDAAHRITPRGGTGMNAAVQGAHDLGWRLAWVLRGWARTPLLDGYEAERRPVAAHNVERSADPRGGSRSVDRELPVDLGGRIPHVWLPSTAGATDAVSTLDLLGPGLTLFTGPHGAGWIRAARSLAATPPLVVRGLDAITARGLGVHDGGALLARPDGAPVGWWPAGSDADGALRAALRAVTCSRGRDAGREVA